jgi:hypothetical protein
MGWTGKMAEITHSLYPDIVIDTGSGVKQGGQWKYDARIGGTTFKLPNYVPFDPATLEAGINDPGSPVYGNLSATLKRLQFASQGDRGLVEETIVPALTRTPANVIGAPVDIINAVTRAVVDTPINFGDWMFGGFEGDMPSERYASAEVPLGGSESIARGMEALGDAARDLRRAAEKDESGLLTTIPAQLLRFIEFDTTPDERSDSRQYISMITQIIGAAPVEGALIAKFAVQLAKTTKSPTKQAIYDAVSEMQVNNPASAALYEAVMGGGVGGGMVASLEGLEAVWPDAPQWAKNTIMAGGGIAVPIGTMTAVTTGLEIGFRTPVVRWPLHFVRGLAESLTVKGAERAAARAVQTFGSDWKHRSEILGVTRQLRLALKEGRNMDKATRIAFTTPQLARNEANVLEAQLNAAANNMPESTVAQQRQLIQELRRYANFQEGHLKTLSEGGGIGARAYAMYSERMMDRRDSIFKALDDAIFKMDLGGRADDGIEPSVIEADYAQGPATGTYEFNVNRQRAMQEGREGATTPAQAQAVSEAFENVLGKFDNATRVAIKDAEARVAALRESMPKDMSTQDRADFNRWIRGEVETAYIEIDALEDVLWNTIGGMNQPKTASYLTPDGTDLGPQILIDGVPIGEHFAAKAAALEAGEAENQSRWLWKLSGRDALVDQASKGGGPDAEKVARQNVLVKQQEAIVAQRQQDLNAASKRLEEVSGQPYESARLRTARQKVAELEAGRSDPSFEALSNTRKTAWDQQYAIATERLRILIAETGESYNPAIEKAQNSLETAQGRLNTAQTKLDTATGNLEISLGKGVTDADGNPVNLADEITDTSALGVKMVDGVLVGRKGREVQNIISHLKAEMAAEGGRPNGKPAKIAAIGDLIDDLQRAIGDPENFSVNMAAYDAARIMTSTKKTLFGHGIVGRFRGFTAKGETRVPVERTIEKVAPQSGQETNLRELETALSARYENMTGDNTPFRLIRDDGVLRPELDPDFNLERYAEGPPPPFETMPVDGGRSLGLKVVEGTQPTDSNIKLIRNTLWDRFKDFGIGDEFNSAAASLWIKNNKSAIDWLKKATGKDTGFEDLVSAERVVKSINNATARNLDDTIKIMREDGAFNDEFTEEGFKFIVKEAAKRESNLLAAGLFLGSADPLALGQNFLTSYLRSPNPQNLLRDTMRVLKNGALEDGSNPALEGFKLAIAEAIIGKGLTSGKGSTRAAEQARKLGSSLGTTVKLWDPEALSGIAQNARYGRLLGELYGKDAPEFLRKIAEGARLQSTISDAATPGVRRLDRISDEVAGNLGRVIGGFIAGLKVVPVSSLVLTGAGRRYSMSTIAEVRGSAVDKLIIDFLMNPKLMAAAITKHPLVSPHADASMWKRAKLWAHDKFIGDNARRIERIGKAPGVIYEIGEPTKYQDQDERAARAEKQRLEWKNRNQGKSPSASLPMPQANPASGMPGAAPVQASVLGQIDPFGGRQFAAAAPQDTVARMEQFGLPLFTAAHGGIASIKPKKPRQMVI